TRAGIPASGKPLQPDDFLLHSNQRGDQLAGNVSEREAREVAEAARETEWRKPSFGKELFLGNFRLDLIHPHPRLDAAAVEKGEAFLARFEKFLRDEVDPLEIERDSRIPDHVVKGREEISALLLTEPDVGSDPARLATTAVPTDDGAGYVLNGTKLWTTNGVVADLLVVMAQVPKSEGHRGGITAFVVEADSPGIEVV